MADEDLLIMRNIDPFSPQARQVTQSVVHQNYGCGAGNLVCSISVSGEVNPCSFLGPEYAAANIRDRSLAEIWHRSAGFRAIRELPHSEPTSAHGNTATFGGGCRARALKLNGSINAPDPWIADHADMETVDLEKHGRPVRNPLAIVDVTARSRVAGPGARG
jgi:radical SAM protein with 4Fe4S-binding SPASM domain